ncbi:aldehyde dehydrogenase family protein [bacterium]|nr:aldehyde dehydrogenase family protein [bacterium]
MSPSSFRNEPLLDFSLHQERERFQRALDEVRAQAAAQQLRAAPLLQGEKKGEGTAHQVRNPSLHSEILGTVQYATSEQADETITSLAAAQEEWRAVGFARRAEIIHQVAVLMRAKREELAALMVLEAGKPWGEADADVCEAIDFCEYYALLAKEMDAPKALMPFLNGEQNVLSYAPKGVAVVISPWNFPLAIACGMTVAALVCGNPTVLKPAEQTSLIAAAFGAILLEAGVLPNAFTLLPGVGEEIGAQLVANPATSLICFTGSRAVGLQILQQASSLTPEQRHFKRVILELGGKNAIIIDDDADFDDAVKGVLYSAFGFAGQKCSACSRVIVVKEAYDRFLDRLTKAAGDLIVGPAHEPATYVGPLIDEESQQRVLQAIEKAKGDLTITLSSPPPTGGSFVSPTIFRDVPDTHELWREELFAPVLCVAPADTFDDALRLANDSAYALTGGVFSRSPSHLAQAREQFAVGNLYLNRSITGAIVGRQPFGGFRLSGVGMKAGGPDYLLQFVEGRTVTENTMRKGFTPELA